MCAVDLQRHRHLVRDRCRRSPPRSGRARARAPRRRRSAGARPRRRPGPGAPLNADSSTSQRISSTHERPMPAIARWSRSSECRWRGWRNPLGEHLERRRGPRVRAERGDRLVLLDARRSAAASPTPAAGCRTRAGAARARRRSARAGARPCRAATRACPRAGAARPTSGGSAATRSPASTISIFPARPTRVIARPGERVERRVEGLHRDHARARAPTRSLHPRAPCSAGAR